MTMSKQGSVAIPSEQECRHNAGFMVQRLPFNNILPGGWFCNHACGYYINFDPNYAGSVHPIVIYKDMPSNAYYKDHWTHYGLAYTPAKSGLKVTLSKGG